MPASAAAAERQPVDAPAAVGEALAVAREHRLVGQQVVAERDRLRDLQVREAGHDRVGVPLREIEERAAQRGESRRQTRRSRRAATADVGRDLVVARAAGVQALAGVADQRGQALSRC